MKKIFNILIILFTIDTLSYSQITSQYIDPRDGKVYQTTILDVPIEGNIKVRREWFAENLNYESPGSFCYKDYEAFCDVFGRLYTWDEAQNVCPKGWHLSTALEWEQVMALYGGLPNTGPALKEGGESGLEVKMSGFGELDGTYIDVGTNGYFWTVKNARDNLPGLITVHADIQEVSDVLIGKAHKNACRCVKDHESSDIKR